MPSEKWLWQCKSTFIIDYFDLVQHIYKGCSVYSKQAAVFYRNTDKEITVINKKARNTVVMIVIKEFTKVGISVGSMAAIWLLCYIDESNRSDRSSFWVSSFSISGNSKPATYTER